MADRTRTSPAQTPAAALQGQAVIHGELIVNFAYWWVDLTGTRAQIEAEGIVPVDAQWSTGKGHFEWKANGCSYELTRARQGNRGKWDAPSSDETVLWKVRIYGPDGCGVNGRALHRERQLSKELEGLAWLRTEAGKRESAAFNTRRYRASGDHAFQAMLKAILPPTKKAVPRG